jgi:hypothetical protein
LRWVDPPENAWRGLDFGTLTSLPCELEWDDVSLGPEVILEYQMDTLDDSAEWHPFVNGPESGRVENGFRRVKNEVRFEGGDARHRFIRARLRSRGQSGRSSSAFFIGRDEQVSAPSVRYVGRGERRVRSNGPGEAGMVFQLEITGHDEANRVEYRWRRLGHPESGWRHAGDFGPGRKDLRLRGGDFPGDAKQGERIAVEFRTFNGESYSTDFASAEIAVNRPPSITLATAFESPEAGKPLALPFSVSDEDGDAVTVLYRVDDDVAWSVLPTASGQSVLPADVVSRLVATPEQHKVEVTAFDGLEVTPFVVWPWQSGASREFTVVETQPENTEAVGFTKVGGRGLLGVFWRRDWPQFYLAIHGRITFNMGYALDGKAYSPRYVQATPAKQVRFALPIKVVDELSLGNHTILFYFEKLDATLGQELEPFNFVVTKTFKGRARKD